MPDKEYRGRSGSPAKGFGGAAGVTGTGEDGGAGNGQGGDMSQRIQVGGAGGVTDPKALLPGRLKTRVVALAFGAQRIGALEMRAFPVNGEPIVIWDRLVFCAASVFLAIVPVFVVGGTFAVSGLAKGTGDRRKVCVNDKKGQYEKQRLSQEWK